MTGLRFICRPGTQIRVWDKYDIDFLTVPKGEVETYLADGWFLRADEAYGAAGASEPDLLDNPASVIIPQLEGLSLDALQALVRAETGGKTRKGVLSALNAAVEVKRGQ